MLSSDAKTFLRFSFNFDDKPEIGLLVANHAHELPNLLQITLDSWSEDFEGNVEWGILKENIVSNRDEAINYIGLVLGLKS
jgi:hypothetical protein